MSADLEQLGMYLHRNPGKVSGVYHASMYEHKKCDAPGLKSHSYFLTDSACEVLKRMFEKKKRSKISSPQQLEKVKKSSSPSTISSHQEQSPLKARNASTSLTSYPQPERPDVDSVPVDDYSQIQNSNFTPRTGNELRLQCAYDYQTPQFSGHLPINRSFPLSYSRTANSGSNIVNIHGIQPSQFIHHSPQVPSLYQVLQFPVNNRNCEVSFSNHPLQNSLYEWKHYGQYQAHHY
jgi:hypothetical protein